MTEISKVRENLDAWLKAFNQRDVEALLKLYDSESLYANAGAAMMQGIEEIKPWYEGVFANIEGKLLFKEEHAFQDGRLALLVGKYFFQSPVGQAPSNNAAGRVALVYRRADDGRWRLLFDMDNAPPDCTPADFN
ncbi:MAG: YybH family protein [Leptolyngbyaceae cyanobacterium]